MRNDALRDAIVRLVERLSEAMVTRLADTLADLPGGAWAEIQPTAVSLFAVPYYHEQVKVLLTAWQTHAPHMTPQAVALALQSTLSALQQQRKKQTLELVWTGPPSAEPLRRTAPVLHQLIDEAQRDLLIVVFAVYDIAEIREALHRAATRGVQLRLILESAKASGGKVSYEMHSAFDAELIGHAQIYHWPIAQRLTDSNGKHGSLHAKCAIADGATMLLSSANLTHYALNLNMELGVLIRGGKLPQQVAAHFQCLIEQGVLVRVGGMQ